MISIKFNDLGAQWNQISETALPRIQKVLETGNFILGNEVKIFEENFKTWNQNEYAVGVANGTDALIMSVDSLDLKGTSMFYVPANTYIATLLGVVLSKAKNYDYKLIDCDDYYQMDMSLLEIELDEDHDNYDNLIVMPVHLYGSCCDMVSLMKLKDKFNFEIIEDCSQAHGTVTAEGKKVGTYGRVAAFSLYPGKNLGAAGDSGIITTNDNSIYNSILKLRNLGSIEKYKHEVIGRNSRLDTLQSVILDEKLKMMDIWNEKRVEVANHYRKNINNEFIHIQRESPHCKYNTYHIFPVLTDHREKLMKFLSERGVPTLIHYPIPIDRTQAFFTENSKNVKTNLFSDKLVSLPIHPFMTNEELEYICEMINQFSI